jgi:hypothetical protein
MIHHVSIAAREPQRVAEVLAELMNGKCFPFGPLEGAFMAASGDTNGTMIEVYPERATLNIPDSTYRTMTIRSCLVKIQHRRRLGRSTYCCRCRMRRKRSSVSALARAGAPRPSAAACRDTSRSSTSSSSGWKIGC